MGPIQRRAGDASSCSANTGPSSTVARPDWATPWATDSQASRKFSQSTPLSGVMRLSGSISQSTSKTAHSDSTLLRTGNTVDLPDPEAPVTTKSGAANDGSVELQSGHRAQGGSASINTG